MLICFVLCAAAVLPTALSDKPEPRHIEQPVGSSNDLIQKLSTFVSSLRNQPQIHLQKYEDRPLVLMDDTLPSLRDFYISLSSKNPYLPSPDLGSSSEIRFLKGPLGGGHILRRDTVLDSIGGGHLLRREARLDSLGGGHLLKRHSGFGALDPIGGGHLLKREFRLRQLDSIGGGHLLKRDILDSIGGGHLLKRYALDPIGGGHLLKREFEPRRFDSGGGEVLLGKGFGENTGEPNSGYYMEDNEPTISSRK